MGTLISVFAIAALSGALMANFGGHAENLGVSIAVGSLVGLALCLWYYPIYEAKRRNHPKLEMIQLINFFSLVFWPLWLVSAIWSHSEPVRPKKRPARPVARVDDQMGNALSRLAGEEPTSPQMSRPGSFKVVGVDRASGLDTQVVLHAESEENVRVKAELRGIIVTKVVQIQ